MKGLKEFEQEFQEILDRDDLEQDRKDIQLSALMTEMERIFKIPILKEEQYETENKDVIALYRKISMSRKLGN